MGLRFSSVGSDRSMETRGPEARTKKGTAGAEQTDLKGTNQAPRVPFKQPSASPLRHLLHEAFGLAAEKKTRTLRLTRNGPS